MKTHACLTIGISSMVLMLLSCRQDAAVNEVSEHAAAAPAPVFAGEVVETTNSGGYTYVFVSNGTERIWAASTPFAVKVGDSVLVPTNTPMDNFSSKTLNRTFDVIYFTPSIRRLDGGKGMPAVPAGHPPVAGAGLPAGHPALPSGHGGLPAAHPPLGTTAQVVRVDVSGIERAPGGKTVAEIHAESVSLAGREVTVRGKVVKFNPEIMGRNWIHLQDGTCVGAAGDLTVTSTNAAKVGDQVLATGVVATNRNFGFGYAYAVMIENAKVRVESP